MLTNERNEGALRLESLNTDAMNQRTQIDLNPEIRRLRGKRDEVSNTSVPKADLLTRIRELHRLAGVDLVTAIATVVVSLLLILMELTPIFVKVFSTRSEYLGIAVLLAAESELRLGQDQAARYLSQRLKFLRQILGAQRQLVETMEAEAADSTAQKRKTCKDLEAEILAKFGDQVRSLLSESSGSSPS